MPPPPAAVEEIRTSTTVHTAASPPKISEQDKQTRQDKTPPLYKLSKIPYTYFLSEPKNAKPTVRQIKEAQLRKLILITIAGYGDADGTKCWASAETIAFDTGCGVRCISDHKFALTVAGYLSRGFRQNLTDDCVVHIPEHVWAEVKMKSADHKEMLRNRASKGGWAKVGAAYGTKVGAAYGTKVGAAYGTKVGAAYDADDLSTTSLNTSSLPLETPATNKQSLKDNGPKLVRGQREPIEDFKLRVAKLTSNKILFTTSQIFTLKKVLSEFTSDELFVGFRLAWDEISDDQIKYMASKFVANAHVQAQQGRDTLLKQVAEKVAIDAAKVRIESEAEAYRAVQVAKLIAEQDALEEELPD
jgi:hypothetical protein